MLRRFVCVMVAGLLWGGIFIPAASAGEGKKLASLDDAFATLKSLSGEWKVLKGDKEIPKSKVIYRVTAAGSAVIETLFPGTKMEMVSVYHRDGDKLVMTHYCAAKNQPRFKACLDKKTGDLILDFAGGTNLDAKKDPHIHGGRIHFIDADNIASTWQFFIDGKLDHEHSIRIQRVKK